jgi:hypothetical protein
LFITTTAKVSAVLGLFGFIWTIVLHPQDVFARRGFEHDQVARGLIPAGIERVSVLEESAQPSVPRASKA